MVWLTSAASDALRPTERATDQIRLANRSTSSDHASQSPDAARSTSSRTSSTSRETTRDSPRRERLETAPDRSAAHYPDGSQAGDDGADSKGAVCKHISHFGEPLSVAGCFSAYVIQSSRAPRRYVWHAICAVRQYRHAGAVPLDKK